MAKVYSRNDIIQEARTWIGTPYLHQQSSKNVATDCIGLIKSIYEHFEEVVIEVPTYSYDWGDANGNEDLLTEASKLLVSIPLSEAQAGDVVGVRWRKGRVVKHAMILTSPTTAIHSYYKSGVVEINLNKWWTDKFAVAYKFPGV